MKAVSPQGVSQVLAHAGVPMVAWDDKFKVEGVSVQRAPFGQVTVNVEFASKAVRVAIETAVIAALTGKGFDVRGGNGVLSVRYA